MDANIIDATGQRWKLVAFYVAFLVGGGFMAYAMWRIDQLEPVRFAQWMGAGVVIVLGALAWCSLALRCPSCRTPWFWHAISRQPSGTWNFWLAAMTACPECGRRSEAE